MRDASARLKELLVTSSNKHTDDQRNRLGTGIKIEVHVFVESVTAEVSLNRAIKGVGHIEKFVLNGRWSSTVSKDIYQIGRLVNRSWGDHCEPYGFFSVKAKALDGDIAGRPEIEVQVENKYDERNRFALQFAEAMIRDTTREALGLDVR
jgi:hypothetical protein